MRFTIPQFIEHEAKIIGPFTFKQFIFIGIAAVICFVVYFTASFIIFIVSCVVFGGISFALAVVKVGGQSLPVLLANMLKFNSNPKMYIWKKGKNTVDQTKILKR